MSLKRVQRSEFSLDEDYSPLEGGFGVLRRFRVKRQLSPDLIPGVDFLLKTPKQKSEGGLDSRLLSHLD